MTSRRAFIDHDAFHELLRDMPRVDGGAYEDIETVYGDMSRLVVGMLYRMSPDQMQREYEAGSWKGSANVRAIHEAAKLWMSRNRSQAPNDGIK